MEGEREHHPLASLLRPRAPHTGLYPLDNKRNGASAWNGKKLLPPLCIVRPMNTTTTEQLNVLPAHWEHVGRFRNDEPIEIRFHGKGIRDWQLLGSVASNGVVHYRLESNPRGNYPFSLSYLVGDVDMTLPMKAYKGWQYDVLAWVVSHTNTAGAVYTIDEVL